jgi:CheY-like chemotaxis protein
VSRVLVCEDDEIQRRYLCQRLESAGHDCVCLGTVAESLEYLRQEIAGEVPRLDIAIVDMQLDNGKFSGIRVLNDLPARIKRVVISGYSREDIRDHVDPLANVPFYFTKPLMDKDEIARLMTIVAASGRKEKEQ